MKINFSNITENLAIVNADREAVVNVERAARYTFEDYHSLTNQIANFLQYELKLTNDDHYVCILENDSLSLMSPMTAFKGPGCICYTNVRDSVAEHSWQIDTVEPKAVFIESGMLADYFEFLSKRKIQIVVMDEIPSAFKTHEHIYAFWDLVAQASSDNPNLEFDLQTTPKVIRFTGGTTGKGKCARYSIDSFMMCRDSFFMTPEPHWHRDVRFLHLAPLSHGTIMMSIPTHFQGGCNVTINVPDLDLMCEAVSNEKITGTFLVPTLLYRLLEHETARDGSLSSLETVFYGAAPMSPTKLDELKGVFGSIFVQAYAATEHLAISIAMMKDQHGEISGSLKHLASAGKPVPGIEIKLVNDDGTLTKRGEVGEILMRSRSTCLGYYKNPEKTEEEFTDGFWKSGDLARMDENGFIYIVDRKKDLIITGGFNVYATEIEAAMSAHPAVMLSAAIGVPHEDWGEAIHGEVVLKDGASVSEKEFKTFLRQKLGSIKTPKTISFVDELPLSAAGKVLRRKVREKRWAHLGRNVN